MNKLDNCLAKLLNVIKILQDNADKIDCNDNTCTKPYLGPNAVNICFNTRPVMLYRCDNNPVTLNYTNSNGENLTTNIFRIKNVCNDSVGVLLLEQTTDTEGNVIYNNTNTFATINLDCVCAIKCLADTIVSNV